VLATGSDNTSRYFDYYFGKYPNIIRKNRSSVAIITGKESESDLENLGRDIFQYFGLGCRNVSKIYVAEDYEFKNLFEGLEQYKDYLNHHKYMNNYDYNKAVLIMDGVKILDNGFFMLKGDANVGGPISVLNYEYYSDKADLLTKIKNDRENIQCIVGDADLVPDALPFGKAQMPHVDDYADNVDTMQFLSELN